MTLLCKWVIWMGKKKKKYWCLLFFPSLIDFSWWFCICTCHAMFNPREHVCLPSVYHVFKMKTFKVLSFDFLKIYIFYFLKYNYITCPFFSFLQSFPCTLPPLSRSNSRPLFRCSAHSCHLWSSYHTEQCQSVCLLPNCVLVFNLQCFSIMSFALLSPDSNSPFHFFAPAFYISYTGKLT